MQNVQQHDESDDKKKTTNDGIVMNVTTSSCLGVTLGFGLNSVLLPAYALAVQYTSITTPMLNTMLHSWLCMCYTIQGLVLHQLVVQASPTRISASKLE